MWAHPDPRRVGRLSLGMMSSNNFLTTEGSSFLVEYALVYPEKVPTNTSKYLQPYSPGFSSMKSTSQLTPGCIPLSLLPIPAFVQDLAFTRWYGGQWVTTSSVWVLDQTP